MESTPLRILMVQRFDLLNVACARRIISIAQELLKMGHRVTLIDFPHQTRREQLPAIHSRAQLEGIDLVNLSRSGSAVWKNIHQIARLAQDHDIVHLWKSYPDAALPALWGGYLKDKPIHYDWDDWEEGIALELTGSKSVQRLARLWEENVLKYVDTISTASEALRNRATELGFPQNRIFEAPVGATPQPVLKRKDFDPDRPRLIHIGQLEVAAYAEQTIEAFRKLLQRKPKATLTIVGGGRYLEDLRRKLSDDNLEQRVQLTGYRPAEEIKGFLEQSDVGLAPFEDTPITRAKSPLKIVEYMAEGLPVVGSDVGEVPRMVLDAGRTVPPGDIEAFAEAIATVTESEGIWRGFSEKARARVEQKYNWTETTRNILRGYRLAIHGFYLK